MWNVKQKATNEETKQRKQQTDTDNGIVVTRGKGWGGGQRGTRGQIYGDGGRLGIRQ